MTIRGQSVVRTGTLAYMFAKRDGAWKIEAQGAAGPSLHVISGGRFLRRRSVALKMTAMRTRSRV